MHAYTLFPCHMCVDYLGLNNSKIEQYAYSLRGSLSGRQHSNRGGWHSDYVGEEPEMQELVSQINTRLEQLRYIYKFKSNLELKVSGMWININSPNNYNTNHTHPDSFISGTYYVKVPKNSGSIVLKHPSVVQEIHTNMFLREEYFDSFDEHNSITWAVQGEENKILFFPGWVEHEVTQNLSTEDRISIAFNSRLVDRK